MSKGSKSASKVKVLEAAPLSDFNDVKRAVVVVVVVVVANEQN